MKDLKARKQILQVMRSMSASYPMDPNFKRIKYVRYADDFVILVIGSYKDATDIRAKIKYFLSDNCGLTLNLEKTVISNVIKPGFKFLGADCRRANMTKNHVVRLKRNVKVRATTRLRVNIDLNKVYKKLVAVGVAKWDDHNKMVPRGTAKNGLINLAHADIVAFYNSKIRGLLSFYSFAGNRKRLSLVLWILTSSCALTLAKKNKLKTQGAAFKKFGPLLSCKETGVKIFKPSTLRAIHEYNVSKPMPQNLEFLNTT